MGFPKLLRDIKEKLVNTDFILGVLMGFLKKTGVLQNKS